MDSYFPTQLQEFQFYSKYSRWIPEAGRRETFPETVNRAVDCLVELSENKLDKSDYDEIKQGMLDLEIMPSMRLVAMAGEAVRRNNVCLFNCAYSPIDSLESFVEMVNVTMCGTGAGYSVERKYTNRLPVVKTNDDALTINHVVEDSSEGWAYALKVGLGQWFDGGDVIFDYSQIRPVGAPLKTKGGRASGYKSLEMLLNKTRSIIQNATGRKLTPLECHDIACTIGDCVIQGGVRRSALISLFDADDESMIECKSGDNLTGNEVRWNANNSAVWTSELSHELIKNQMYRMHESGRGEPGIFSRYASVNTMPKRRNKNHDFGTNPCGEITLRPFEFCNLSLVVARHDDTVRTLRRKVRLATIIGTIQASATNFPYLRDIWKTNCEEERLLGVDITGQRDCPLLSNMNVFSDLKRVALEINKQYAKKLGINLASSVTCVKPSGNSSVMLDCGAGIHARFAKYYIRRVRVNDSNPMSKVLRESGFKLTPENGQTEDDCLVWVASFPVKAPNGAVIGSDLTAIDQLEWWKKVKLEWCEHNPSATISYDENELDDMIQWLFENQKIVGGLSFLPKSNANYDQMPYEELTYNEYRKMAKDTPDIDFSLLAKFEKEDMTEASQELACVAGLCEI